MKKVFNSKVDFSIILVIGIFLFVPIVPLLILDFSLTLLMIYILVFLFIIKMLFSISYVVDDNILEIKYLFFFSEKICIDEIISIKPSRSMLSAPAASFDRLQITLNNKNIIISPRHKKRFIDLLCTYNPHIIVLS